jgi:CPA1 family monovalent cation:H+ antiporter
MSDIMVVLGLLACVVALVPLAERLAVPYPILLVLGGLALGFVPNNILPDVVLRPDVVFLLFLPPLLYWAALTTPWREFRAYLRPILLLAVGLVVATMLGVAGVAHAVIPALGWPVALVLGAIVSPPDAVAVTAIADRLGLPHRVSAILEGESLVNDASALVAYGTAVAVVTEGTFSPASVGLAFIWEAAGGIAIGLLAGWLIALLRRRMDDPLLESAISLLTPFAAYLPAYLLGSSGVLAAVVAGFAAQRYAPLVTGSRSRLQADSVWEVANFLLNGLVFILIGLQLHPIFLILKHESIPELLWQAAAVSLAAIVVRICWVLMGGALARATRRRADDEAPTTAETAVIAWAGMRGVVSLAAAQSLPAAFPHRPLILFLTFGVILFTLVAQGLTLPALIRRLGLSEGDAAEREEARARLAATQEALAQLDALAAADGATPEVVEDVRRHYMTRARLLAARVGGGGGTAHHAQAHAHRALLSHLIDVERRTIVELRNSGTINDEVLRRIQRDLDLDEVRLGTGTR